MCAFYSNKLPSRTLALSIRGKQQVCASQRVLQHQGASCAAPQKQGRLQLDAGHNAPESKGKTGMVGMMEWLRFSLEISLMLHKGAIVNLEEEARAPIA
nr:hypothetical protein CFP56_43575 [Quercus suber]